MRRAPVPIAIACFGLQVLAMIGGGLPAAAWFSDLTPILIAFAAAAACVACAVQLPRSERRVWMLFGSGALAWGLGDLGFSIYGWLDIDPSSALTLADVGYLALIPLWGAALIVHPSRSSRGIDRLGTTFDALSIVAVAASMTMAYVLVPSLHLADDLAGAAVNWVYPVGDLVLLCVMVSIRARSTERLGIGDVMVAGAVLTFAAGDIVYARLALLDAYDIGNPVDLTWSVAFILIALAAGRLLGTKRAHDDDRTSLPLLAAFGIAGLLLLAVMAVVTRLENTIVLAGAVAAGLLLVGRLVVLLVDRARLMKANDEKVVELERANAARERFIATVSHDLRAPLASISGFAELLREPSVLADPEQVSQMTSSIERNARRLARLTEDLLCAGQFASGHPPPLRLSAIDTRQVVDEAIRDTVLGDKATVSGSRWIYAMADKQRVQQVIVNLVDNAFKHSGCRDVHIAVTSTDEGPAIEVADAGVGIAPDRIAQIFDPFVSDYGSTSNVGLGLYVVRNLVGAMGGRITVTSEAGIGTTFRLTLPPAVHEPAFADVSNGSRVDHRPD